MSQDMFIYMTSRFRGCAKLSNFYDVIHKQRSLKTSSLRTPWFCGLMHHVSDQEVEGSNLVTAKSLLGEK